MNDEKVRRLCIATSGGNLSILDVILKCTQHTTPSVTQPSQYQPQENHT
jgi:hypothetical protein